MSRSYQSSKFDEQAALEEYRELLKEYDKPTDDDLVLKMQQLNTAERAILCLYIACEYRINYFSRLLHTNNAYGKKIITDIQNKMRR